MKYSLGYCLLLCLLLTRVQTKPQITKLFPIEEIPTNDHRESNNETRLFDKLLGKLRSTYNFVFHKTDDNANNKTNVKKISFDKTPNSNLETYKFNWNNPNLKLTKQVENPKEEEPVYQTRIQTLYDAPRNDRFDELQPLESLEPLMPLDFNEEENENINKNDEVEFVTPATNSNFSATLGRHFVEWLGSLLGISYGIYAKFTRAIHNNNTLY